jgi:peptidoglycan/xylan/chitin deacetylase (PgdA/CDA1 family)
MMLDRSRLTRVARETLTRVDLAVSHVGVQFERPALIALLFHSVFENDAEIETDVVYPQEAITRERLRCLVDNLLVAGYRFVATPDVERGLEPGGRYAWLTFDDGYANNLRLVEVLAEYQVPATLFVATGYVESGRRFWWDAVYAERRRRGQPVDVVKREIESLRRRPVDAIAGYLEHEFGPDATRPRTDLDRPVTEEELKALAASPFVELGNHTVEHPLLDSLEAEAIERELRGAQTYLDRLTGTAPKAVSYPNGNYDARVIETVRALGLPVGVTTVRRKTRVPLAAEEKLELGRFQLDPVTGIEAQVRVLRSELPIANTLRRIKRRTGAT